MNRPREADQLYFAVTDHLIDKMADHFGDEVLDDEGFWDWYEDNIEKPVKMLLCERYGHEPVADQCNMPEHDHCAWCMGPMPFQAKRPR